MKLNSEYLFELATLDWNKCSMDAYGEWNIFTDSA